jgi:RND family efflux transporter MFP subunit
VEVADPSALDVDLAVSPDDAGRIRAGAQVSINESGNEDRGTGNRERGTEGSLGTGRVVSVSAAVDSGTRSVAVRVRLERPARALRLGETVSGRIVTGADADAVVVPVEALVPEGERLELFVVDSSGVAHARAVRVGGRTDSVAEIISGLRAGEKVVTYGAYGVEDGARIEPVAPSAPVPP